MWLQRGDVPEEYRSVRHLGSTLLNVTKAAGFRYKDDNQLDLSQCIGFSQHETLMVRLEEEGLKKVTGTVIGLITERSASMKLSDIAQNKISKEVLRIQAHHYVVIPDQKRDREQTLQMQYYMKLWAVAAHQPGSYRTNLWGEFLSHMLQTIFRMDHPTDRSVELEAGALLDVVMQKAKGVWPAE
jgi:hypothetical protein